MTKNKRPHLLLLSAYHAPSHKRWARGLIDFLAPHFEITLKTQPPRHFPWRSRGNSLFWAFDDELADLHPDLIVATSMVDLAGLKGMVPHLATIPTAVYYHENQFAYPTQDDRLNANLLVTNLYTALAADQVLFNSPYNRDSMFEKADHFLDRMPDQIPGGVIDELRHHSQVLPVPLENSLFVAPRVRHEPDLPRSPRIVWNHRWEHDKAPDRFFEALFDLHDEGLDFRLVVLGQRFRQAPPIFEEARQRLRDRIDHFGYVEDRETYLNWLRRSDLVVSTALHEFQGLAVQEAVVLGCRPVLPDRLAYPDFFDAPFLYPSHADSAVDDRNALKAHLRPLLQSPQRLHQTPPPDLSHLSWKRLGERYLEELQHLL